MRNLRIVAIVILFVFVTLLTRCPVEAQTWQSKSKITSKGIDSLDKKLERLEYHLTVLLRKVRQLRRMLHLEQTITIVRLHHTNPDDVASLINQAFKNDPLIRAQSVAKLKSVAITGNPEVLLKLRSALRRLDSSKGNGRVGIYIGSPDRDLMERAIRAMDAFKPNSKKLP